MSALHRKASLMPSSCAVEWVFVQGAALLRLFIILAAYLSVVRNTSAAQYHVVDRAANIGFLGIHDFPRGQLDSKKNYSLVKPFPDHCLFPAPAFHIGPECERWIGTKFRDYTCVGTICLNWGRIRSTRHDSFVCPYDLTLRSRVEKINYTLIRLSLAVGASEYSSGDSSWVCSELLREPSHSPQFDCVSENTCGHNRKLFRHVMSGLASSQFVGLCRNCF
jgi:hypothetical protein